MDNIKQSVFACVTAIAVQTLMYIIVSGLSILGTGVLACFEPLCSRVKRNECPSGHVSVYRNQFV